MKNKSYIAFEQSKGKEVTPESWLIDKKDCRVLYDGRYCAVSGFFYAIVDGKYSVLAEKRGKGTPDFQGYWCCPCGFLEADENSREGIKRETKEECGFSVPYHRIKVVGVETEPGLCNNGNVTIRHRSFLGKQSQPEGEPWKNKFGGEKDEVDKIAWIPLTELENYSWAFGHEETIKKYSHSRLTQRILELLYKWLPTK